ncbi:hypothetical protein KY333_04195 [Candidatus Woesearchaeota archaeon]|nr:hypothetical protein [Candidatus Woesearchaeota archaeon]
MKKAQITVFIIIGIMLLLGTALLIYVVSLKPAQKSETDVASQSLRKSAVQPVKEYVLSCLDVVSSDALELVGKQGGRLFVSQGGITPDPTDSELGVRFLEYDYVLLPYSIVPPEGTAGIFFSSIPKYPWISFPYLDDKTSDIGFFGLVQYPALYREIDGELVANSIQEQLETYISNNIGKCTIWSNKFAGFNITTGTPNTTMVIAENRTHLKHEEYISFVLNWPITIKEISSDAETTINEFSVNHPIAFGRIYYTVKDILEQDVSNVSYEPGTTDSYFITINNDVFNKDDVIVYQDGKYKLKAKPYEFRIARKNRAPGIYWIDQDEIDKSAYCVNIVKFVLQDKKLKASPDLEDDDIFPVNVTAVDPDNDVVTFKLKPQNPKVDEYAVALYADNPEKGGLLFDVIASDGELDDYQKIRIIPKGCEQK